MNPEYIVSCECGQMHLFHEEDMVTWWHVRCHCGAHVPVPSLEDYFAADEVFCSIGAHIKISPMIRGRFYSPEGDDNNA